MPSYDKKGNIVNAMGLEALILAKFRANRPAQDYPDLRALAIHRKSEVKWNLLQKLANNEPEFKEIKNLFEYISKN